jgi:hypothetical protein
MESKVAKIDRFHCINKKACANAHVHTCAHKVNDDILFALPEILDRVASQSRRSLGLYLLAVHPTWDELATRDVDCHESHT